MKKVSSHTQLTDLANSPANSQGAAFVQRPKGLVRPKSNDSLSAQTKTMAALHYTANAANTGSEVMYAVMNKGLAASQCLVNIEEIEGAPALRDEEVSSQLATSLASCIATQVVPDVGNGEMIASKAAELSASSAKAVEVRYMQETKAAARPERRLSRKRSRGELTVEEKELLDGHEVVGKVIDEVERKNTRQVAD
jgi:hypothetical protein